MTDNLDRDAWAYLYQRGIITITGLKYEFERLENEVEMWKERYYLLDEENKELSKEIDQLMNDYDQLEESFGE